MHVCDSDADRPLDTSMGASENISTKTTAAKLDAVDEWNILAQR
jgi:hypothetical protein